MMPSKHTESLFRTFRGRHELAINTRIFALTTLVAELPHHVRIVK